MNKLGLGKQVSAKMDRPLGSRHPNQADLVYPVNYGYVPGVIGGDGEEQDAYVLGVDVPLENFTGQLIAIIHRRDDCENKWVVVPDGVMMTVDEIRHAVHFQEQYFDSVIEML